MPKEIYRCLHGGETCRFMSGKEPDDSTHLFERLGLLFEQEKSTLPELLEKGFEKQQLDDLVQENIIQWSCRRDGVNIAGWTVDGEKQYKTFIRRHRLAERLLVDILGITLDRDEKTEGPACQMDHSLPDDVADSICTLLGHPTKCPHGHPIPPGECCVAKEHAVKPFWFPLTRVKSNDQYVVHSILDEDAAEKLIRLGISLGSTLMIRQTQPALVLDCEQTTLALDNDIAQHVLVRRANNKN